MPTQIQPFSATWTATPQDVERVIAAVLPHTSGDAYVPMTTCVCVEIADDQFVTVATDRYTMGVAWAKLTDWEEDAPTHQSAKVCIFAADLRRLFAFLKPHKKTAAVWKLTNGSLTASVGEESLTVRTADVDFVKWRPVFGRLVAAVEGSTGTPVMQFMPSKISSFLQTAKAIGEDKGAIRWHFGSLPTDAALVRIGKNFVGLLMPQRIEDALPALDLSAIGIETPAAVSAA